MNEAIKEGDLVRHSAKPEWGVGKALRVRGDTVDVFFADRGGNDAVRLKFVGAALVRTGGHAPSVAEQSSALQGRRRVSRRQQGR